MIFYADDDIDDVILFTDVILKEFGSEVITFTSGDALVRKLKFPPPIPTIVFLDVNMPLKNGLEILEEIKAEPAWSSVPVVMFTTSDSEAVQQMSLDLGANFYITKSRSYSDLVESIRHALSIDWNTFKTTKDTFVYQP